MDESGFSSSRDGRGDLAALLAVLRRRAAIIVFAILAAVGISVALSNAQPKEYRSSATLLFKATYLDAQLSGLPLQLPGDPERDAETNVRLVTTGAVRARVAARLGGDYTAKKVGDNVTATGEGSSSLVKITGAGPTAQEAKRLADTTANEFVASRLNTLRTSIREAEDGVRRQLDSTPKDDKDIRKVLELNLKKLQLLRATTLGDVQIASFGSLPGSPAAPKPVAAGIIGGLIGIIVGLGLALIAEQLDRRVRRPEQLERDLDLPLLSAVPRSKVLGNGEGWAKGLPGHEAEAFRRLRANLRYAEAGKEMRSVVLTSASPESGKTTVAVHLAVAAAAAGARVLLLEADLRRPTMAKILGLPEGGDGLSTILEGPEPDGQEGHSGYVTHWTHANDGANGNGNGAKPQALRGSLRVILAGPTPANPAELLDSDRMRALITSFEEDFDLVVIDGPPAAIVSDPIPLAKQADGVILVARLNRETSENVDRLREQLERLDIRVLGAVANFAPSVESRYYTSTT